MFPVGVSLNGSMYMDGALFQNLKRSGLTHVELSMPAEAFLALDAASFAHEAAKEGIVLWSYHLPFRPYEVVDPSSASPALRESTIAHFTMLMKHANAMGIRRFVVHPSTEPIADADRAARLAVTKENLARLAEVASGLDSVIAVENLPRTCLGRDSSELLELIGADERLRVCFDTNHLLSEDPVEFVRAVGDKIITLHVSDYDFLNERHWLPGEGKLDWQALYAAICKTGYAGPWLYELQFDSSTTITRDHNLTFAALYQNACEVAENQPLTRRGVPIKELKHWTVARKQ